MNIIVKLGLIVTCVLPLSIGCSHPSPGPSPEPADLPIMLVAGVDASDSGSREDKLSYGAIVQDEVESLSRSRDRLLVFVYDFQVREVASEVPTDTDAFVSGFKKALLEVIPCHACHGEKLLAQGCKVCHGSGTEHITRQAEAVTAAVDCLRRVNLKAFKIRLLFPSDGSYEDRSPGQEKRYADAVRFLASVPHLEVIWCGVRPAQRDSLRQHFKTIDAQGRLHIFGPHEEVTW